MNNPLFRKEYLKSMYPDREVISMEEFLQDYHHQIKNYGQAKFKKLQFGWVLQPYVGKKSLPSLENIEFVDCNLERHVFGNGDYCYNQKPEEMDPSQMNKEFNKLSLINCTMFDTKFVGTKFKDLTLDNCEFYNNSVSADCDFHNVKIIGNAGLITRNAIQPFFYNCNFEGGKITEPSVQPSSFVKKGRKKIKPYDKCTFKDIVFAEK